MRDLYEAIEQLSLLLSLRMERAVRHLGWASKGSPFLCCPTPGRQVTLTSTLVHLPLGAAVLFTPRPAPEADDSWIIDIRRTNAVLPESWDGGLRVTREGAGYGLWFRGVVLSDEQILSLLEEFSRPEPTGMGPWLVKLWTLRFGLPSEDLRGRLEREDNIKRLDKLHRALQTAANVDEARRAAEALLS